MNVFFRAMRKLITQPDYVLAIAVLGISAIGLNLSTDYLKLHFRKQPVPMRVSALDGPDGIPTTLGNWVCISVDKPLDPDIEHVLGTSHYLQRRYINVQAVGASRVEQLKTMSSTDRDKELWQIQSESPDAVMDIGVFYYTGMVDTVAHIPERCYVADGFEPTNYQLLEDQKLGVYADGRPRVLSFRFLNFEDSSGRNRIPTDVAYVFHVNGHYESDSLGVRRSLQNLRERYGYYAKVELKTVSLTTSVEVRRKSLAAMEDLLRSLLPEFERCLPDWEALHKQGAAAPVGQVNLTTGSSNG
jgi:hypothetical protein